MMAGDFSSKLDEAHARFSACAQPGERFKLGLVWVDLMLDAGKFLEASEAAGIIKSLAASPLEKAKVFQRSGRALLRLSDYDQARFHMNEALEMLGDQPDPLELCRLYHDMAWLQYRQGYLEKARDQAESAELALSSVPPGNAGRHSAQAECHHLFSLIESASGEYGLAVSRLEKEIGIRHGSGDEQRLAAAYNKLSSILQTKGEITKALDYQQRTLDLAEKAGNAYRKSISLKNFGELYFIMGDLDRSWKCHTESLTMSVQAGNHLGFVFNHAGLGRVYRVRGSAVSAMTEYRQALDAARRIKCRDRESGILADMADLLCEDGLFQEAGERLEQARVLDSERGQDPSPLHSLVSARLAAAVGGGDGKREALRLADKLISGPLIIDDEEFITVPELRMAVLRLRGQLAREQGETSRFDDCYARARELAEEFCRDFEPEQRERFWRRKEMAEILKVCGMAQ